MIINKNKQKGFTLVELSIVLIIIGLIISSVLVGQDLIKSSELRSVVSQYREFQAATITFQGKYNGELPGDIDNGGSFGLGTAGTITTAYQDGTAGAGDANGRITEDDALTNTLNTGEMATFWAHLTTPGAELISGSFDGNGSGTEVGLDIPGAKITDNAGWGVYGTNRNENYLLLGVADDATSAVNTINVLNPLDAFNLDEKIDDGIPTSGDIQAGFASATLIYDDSSANFANAGTSTAHCVNTTPTPDEYQYTATAPLCTLRFVLTTP